MFLHPCIIIFAFIVEVHTTCSVAPRCGEPGSTRIGSVTSFKILPPELADDWDCEIIGSNPPFSDFVCTCTCPDLILTAVARLGANPFYSVAISDDNELLVAGTPYWYNGVVNQGGVWVWSCRTLPCTFGATLTPALWPNSQLGYSVAVDGYLLFSGAPWYNNNGAVFIWNCTNFPTCVQVSGSPIVSSMVKAQFGSSVSMSHSLLAVGMVNYTDTNILGEGGVAVYDCSHFPCTEVTGSPMAPTNQVNAMLGVSIATASGLVVSGARTYTGTKTNQGGLFIWNCATSCVQISGSPYLLANVETSNLGVSLAMTATKFIVAGASYYWLNDASGAVFLLDCSTIPCTVPAGSPLGRVGTGPDLHIGFSVAVSPSNVVVAGADAYDSGKGQFWFWDCSSIPCKVPPQSPMNPTPLANWSYLGRATAASKSLVASTTIASNGAVHVYSY